MTAFRSFVMAGHSRSKNGVASLADVPASHVFCRSRVGKTKLENAVVSTA
jgi:hypothetical protein